MQYVVKERNPDWLELSFQISAAELNQKSQQLQAGLKQKPTAEDFAKMLRQASMREALQTCLQQEGLASWGPPRFKVVQQAPAKGLAFLARISVLPPVKLPAYQPFHLQVEPVPPPTEERVQMELFQLKYAVATPQDVTRPVKWGDIVEIGFVAFDPQGQIIPLSARVRESIIVNGALFYPGFMAQLVGISPQRPFEIQIEAPEDYFHPPVRKQKITYRGQIWRVIEPQHVKSDQELLERLQGQVPSMDALYLRMAEDVWVQNQETWQKNIRAAAVALISENAEIQLSQALLKAELRSDWERLEQAPLKELGQSEALIEQSWQTWQSTDSLLQQVETRLRQNLAMRQIALENKLEVGQAELVATLMAASDTFGGAPPEALLSELRRSKRLDHWLAQMELEKAVDYLMGQLILICNGEVILTPTYLAAEPVAERAAESQGG